MCVASFDVLPEGCTADVLSRTSPVDACRLSTLSTTFRSAANSETVWGRLLPSDYLSIISGSNSFQQLVLLPKKQLYMSLCDEPLLIDNGMKSFFLEKRSGKKCYMIAAQDLSIAWGDTPQYWKWTTLPESRFTMVAVLVEVCWLEIRGKMDTSMLSFNTNYAAYLVFNFSPQCYGFENQPINVSIGITGGERQTRSVYLKRRGVPSENRVEEMDGQYPVRRRDGWLEIEMGEHFSRGDDGELEISLMEVIRGHWKHGLIIQGIEIRPKEGN